MTQAAYRINDQPVDPAAFYAAACDPDHSLAVEACAGAGKTWILISRIVRALLAVDDQGRPACQPHEILAITFTRKAAAEMRQRLHDLLQQFARADEGALVQALAERGVQGLGDPARAGLLAQRLRELYGATLAAGRSVEIRTFHGWFAALLSMAPVAVLRRLQLPVRYELLEDDSRALEQVWPRFLQALSEDADSLTDFQSLVQTHGRHQTRKALEATLLRRTEFERADAVGVTVSSVKRFQDQFPHYLDARDVASVLARQREADLLQQAALVLQGLGAPTFVDRGLQLEAALRRGDLEGVFEALLTADKGGSRSPRKFGKAQSNEIVRQAGTLAMELLEMARQEQAWIFQQRMVRLTRVMIAQWRLLKQERGWVDMQDIECTALELLSDESTAGWVQERLDAQVRHLLIDEFQDTNPLQWQALRAWLSSYAGASRAISVFIVGDPKQSIYRFRRAEPQIWRAASDFVRQVLQGDHLSCDHTRRNGVAVLAGVNAVMQEAAELDAYPGYRQHTTASDQTGQVVRLPVVASLESPQSEEATDLVWRDSLNQGRWLPEEKQLDMEARRAAAWLAGHMAEHALKPSEVMVLSRKRDSLPPLQAALSARGIAASIDESLDLMEYCEVQDLVALLDVLVSPRHDLSLARVLRSPLFGLDNDALVVLARASSRSGRAWLEVLQAPLDEAVSGELQIEQALASAGQTLTRWQVWVQTLPPHDALQAVFEDGDVLARYAAAAPALQRADTLTRLQALVAQALALDGGRYLTAYAFVRALKAGGVAAPASSHADAVRLLTIHTAKGLEADTVLIVNSDAVPRGGETMTVLIDWPGEAPSPSKFAVLMSESRPPACCRESLAQEIRAREREELNILYVAMTRACRTLALSACEPYRDSGRSIWKRLLPHAQAVSVDVTPPCGSASGLALAEDWVLSVLPAAPPRSLVLEPESADQTDGDSALVGMAMHRLLEWGSAEAPAVRSVTREFGLDAQQSDRAVQAARQILQGEGAWIWQEECLRWQGSEVELVHEGRLQRLDRLVQHRDGTWWVIDHKSSESADRQPDLLAQIRAYVRAVAALHPGQPVRAAFLTPKGRMLEIDAGT